MPRLDSRGIFAYTVSMTHAFTIYQGDTLRSLRLERGLTLRDVSAQAFVSLGYLSEVETARKIPTPDVVQRICEVLEVRYTDLLRTVADSLDMRVLEWAHENTATADRHPAGTGVWT